MHQTKHNANHVEHMLLLFCHFCNLWFICYWKSCEWNGHNSDLTEPRLIHWPSEWDFELSFEHSKQHSQSKFLSVNGERSMVIVRLYSCRARREIWMKRKKKKTVLTCEKNIFSSNSVPQKLFIFFFLPSSSTLDVRFSIYGAVISLNWIAR